MLKHVFFLRQLVDVTKPFLCCFWWRVVMVSGQKSHPTNSEQRGTGTPQPTVRNTHPGRDRPTPAPDQSNKMAQIRSFYFTTYRKFAWSVLKLFLQTCFACLAVSAPGPWQHSRDGDAARAAAYPGRNSDPVGRRDRQDSSHREGPGHPTGEKNTPSKLRRKLLTEEALDSVSPTMQIGRNRKNTFYSNFECDITT